MANTLTNADMLNKANVFPVGSKVAVLTGTTADTDIAVTGITTVDKIIFCLRVNLDATAGNIDIADLTSEIVILTDGNIQVTTANTTGDKLVLWWWDVA